MTYSSCNDVLSRHTVTYSLNNRYSSTVTFSPPLSPPLTRHTVTYSLNNRYSSTVTSSPPLSLPLSLRGSFVKHFTASIPHYAHHIILGTGILGSTGDGSAATSATMYQPHDLVLDNAGNIIFSDLRNNRIRKVSTTGVITTIAGTESVIICPLNIKTFTSFDYSV